MITAPTLMSRALLASTVWVIPSPVLNIKSKGPGLLGLSKIAIFKRNLVHEKGLKHYIFSFLLKSMNLGVLHSILYILIIF